MLIAEVGRRYVEQLETTTETMRRRCLAFYDGSCNVGNRALKLTNQARDVVEPLAYDVRDQVETAVNDMQPLDPKDTTLRHSLIELYFGISVLLIGLSTGQLSGTFALQGLLDSIFSVWVELGVLVLLPIYAYLQFRKNAAMDEIERRVWLFAVSFLVGALGAHIFGARLTNTVPSVHFFQPFVLGLLVDTEISPSGLDFYNDRKRLFGVAAAGGIVLPMFLTPYVLGGTYFAPIVMTIAHSAFIALHFQLVIASHKQKNFGTSEAQLAYVIGFALLQLVVSVLFASSELPTPKATAQ